MSSDKIAEAKETVVTKAEDAKKVGEEKAGDAQHKVDETKSSSDPSVKDQAKQKAEEAKKAASDANTKVTDSLASGWQKTKETVSNVNQYPDKK